MQGSPAAALGPTNSSACWPPRALPSKDAASAGDSGDATRAGTGIVPLERSLQSQEADLL